MEGLRKRMLASALAYYQEFVDERRSDPGAQAALRDTTQRVETILADLAVLRTAGDLYLLAQPAALDDLKLDQQQREKVAELAARAGKRWLESFGDLSRLPAPAERARLRLEQARANEAEVAAILMPAQQRRLRQIALQSEGPAAFREPEVVEELSLTQAQREKIRAFEEEAQIARMREARAGSAPLGANKPNVSRRTPVMPSVLSVLTPDQLKRWHKLIGDPIRGSLRTFAVPLN
jgi:hypothetical protein